ncbi:hypothetical protein COV15_03365 [Candidatus Woesearchaeota archaeon CG10_big_fil_rev_8_21_14_0_10_34_12]|nr:MAG: hypothetical protein COV15_03365 [Candidatus Woesearchaeota archaeon CG10_big_fil_rev_8_21_14_0_10_34_12]
MVTEIPQYGLRAYALFFAKHGMKEPFRQNELDWIVRQSMKKKIFSLLLRAGWIQKQTNSTYVCINPEQIIRGLLQFKVPEVIKKAEKDYAFTNLSAIEIWSDYSYVQRGMEKSPYFIKILRKDLKYWKTFFNSHNIQNYIGEGSTIGEYIILIPVKELIFEEKGGYKVEGLRQTMRLAKLNEMYGYAYNYMKNKYHAK